MKKNSFSLLILMLACFTFIVNKVNGQLPTNRKTVFLPGNIPVYFIRVEQGSFLMGTKLSETGSQPDEAPQHKVTISREFYLGQYEVTQSQWQAVLGENPSVFKHNGISGDLPVEMVSWNDIQLFLQKLNSFGIGIFRLPTEAEWEYACRAGGSDRFPWGNDPEYKFLGEYAWFYSRAEGKSHPVGQKKPNAWGLYDMQGNVWEWCVDWYGKYPADSITDPKGVEHGNEHIIRGGSWFNEPEALRSANRHRHPVDSRQTNIGFRLILEQ